MMRFINMSLVTLFTASFVLPVYATTPKIAWYGQLQDGLAEAKRSGAADQYCWFLLLRSAKTCRGCGDPASRIWTGVFCLTRM